MLFSATADQPFHLDNMDFPAVAKATSVSGLPVYYRGEYLANFTALYHPPLYIYTLATWIRVFGFGTVQVRMLGFVCVLLQLWLAIAMVRALLGCEAATRAVPWATAILLLNPYTLQTASITDIDSTVYGPLLCGIVLCVLRMSWRDGQWRTDVVSLGEFARVCVLIALALWAKLTTVLLVLAFIPFLLWPRFRWRKAAALSAAVIAAGVCCFIVSYYAYGAVTGLDVGFSFRFTLESFGKGGSDKLSNLRAMVPLHIAWTGLLPWTVALAALALAVWRGWRSRSIMHIHAALVLCLALVVSTYYCAHLMTYGYSPFKYVFVFWPAVIVLGPAVLSYLVFGATRLFERREIPAYAFIFAAAVFVSSRFLRDLLILGEPSLMLRVLWGIPAAVVIVALLVSRWKKAGRLMIAASFATYTGLALGVTLHQARVPYSTTYDYGQLGFEDTVAFLRSNTTPEDVIASMKDIGFAAERRYVENFQGLYGSDADEERLKKAIGSGRIKFAVFTERSGQDQLRVRPTLRTWVAANTTLVRSFGDYRIYQLNSPRGQDIDAEKLP